VLKKLRTPWSLPQSGATLTALVRSASSGSGVPSRAVSSEELMPTMASRVKSAANPAAILNAQQVQLTPHVGPLAFSNQNAPSGPRNLPGPP